VFEEITQYNLMVLLKCICANYKQHNMLIYNNLKSLLFFMGFLDRVPFRP